MSRRRRVAPALAVAVGLAVVAAIAGFFLIRGQADTSEAAAVATTSSPSSPSTASASASAPATGLIETDPAAGTANPTSGQTVATDEPVVASGAEVAVEVTSWGWNAAERKAQVRGYATGIVEDNGTCTLTLTKDGRTVTADSSAVPDASTTSCGAVAVPGDRLSAGTWQAVLRYESARSSGSAEAVEIEVTP